MTDDAQDRLAAEYAMGLLDADEAALAEALLADDPVFAGLVEDWRARLLELDATAPAEAPDPRLWSRIEAGLARPAGVVNAPSAAPAPTVPVPPAAAPVPDDRDAAVPVDLAERRRARGQGVGLWRAAAITAAAAAVVLAVALATVVRDLDRAPVLVTVLLAEPGRPAAVVNTFPDGRTELVPLTPVDVPAGKALQVWTLYDRERGPVSVGLIDVMRSIELGLEGLPRPAEDQLFEITLEPAGGSPTGRPTGPILMKGTADRAL